MQLRLIDYGHFSKDGTEFIVSRPDTPAPWVNYISNGRYTGLVTNAGGGFSYWVDPRDSRITRWRYNSLPWDRPGRYVYIREIDGDYWSLSWQPTPKEFDFYECRHGMGYTRIQTERRGLFGQISYFVPLDDDLEIWLVRLENRTYEERRVAIFPYVELCLGHALVDLINQPNDQHFNLVNFNREDRTLYATKNYWVTRRGVSVEQPNKAWDKYVFFTTSLPVVGWDGSKDAFIGRWRSESNPAGVEEGRLSDTNITAGDACAALHSEFVLGPEEQVEFTVLLGVTDVEDHRAQARAVVSRYIDPAAAGKELDRVRKWWEEYLSTVRVETPDPEMNLMLNVWGKRQAWVTFNMNRNAGYYHGGLLFGVGIRDQCQDLMGPLLSQPDLVTDRIAEVISHQFQDGSTLHNFFKLTGQGEKTGHSDTPLWLPFAVTAYIKETGDFDFLDRLVPFQDGGEPASVLDHIIRAVDYALSNLTPNHLPKFGPGDWNDTLDYVGRRGIGESVWVGEFLCFILRGMIELLEMQNAKSVASRYREDYVKIAQSLNERCWDGDWYIRGTRDDGGVIGSSKNEEGRIFMNAQSWAVISGIAPPERAIRCMESAYQMLGTPRGPKILHPAYTKVDPGIGLATRCVPGKKENGAIFNHVASWAILAECILGHGDRAYEWYRKCMPMIQASDPDVYRMEPYVYSEYVTSPDHPTFGQASHSWLTGSAVWMLRDGIDWILGVRPTYDGLLVDPCIPKVWDGYKITRRFRGATYEIEVRNPDHVEHGVVSIEVDGKKIEGNVLPVLPRGITAKVLVTMGGFGS
ncbi:MAG: glycosyl transferase family 36 [Armatimonadetes bacterium]|nr:glycosyl transferase family 36 [Armatimonadota bacterium]